MKTVFISAWTFLGNITKAGIQLVKAAIMLAIAGFFLAILFNIITG